MQKISWHLTASFVIISAVIGVAFGYYLTPDYQQTMYSKEEMGLGQADRWVDRRYINAMIAHHRGAILVAQQAQKQSRRKEIQNLASEILKNEPVLIDKLYGLKAEMYNDSRRVRDPNVPNLGTFDENFDLRFLNAVISHHEAGVKMTQEIRTKSSRNEILDDADAVENFLKESSVTLKNWRKQWYKI